MVFESLVTDLVNRFLGDFIENLDKSQLKLGIWGGDVVLNNLFVKENAFDELDLPLKVLHGNIGNLTLKIPWSNLYSAPVIANLDGLYVVAVPNLGVAYNAEKEDKASWEAKLKELNRIEELKKLQAQKIKPDPKADTFAEKMVTQVIKNLQVNVTNIHIRYEDHFTNPQRPFSIGVTLSELVFQTTDENWNPMIIKDTVSQIFKMVKLDSLAMYWNSKTTSYLNLEREEILNKMKSNIIAPGKAIGYQYMVEPITSSAKLRLNTKPENENYSIPKILLNVLFEEIAVVLAKTQYCDIMEVLESFERLNLASKYRKYRPAVTTRKGNSKAWWKFAYTCILEETVRRRRKMWSWQNMLQHRKMTREYKDCYKRKIVTKKVPADLTTQLEYLEKSLDVFDITLARQQAEIEVKSEGVKKQKEKAEAGWFGGWFGGGKKKEETKSDDANIGDQFEKLMTSDEKAKLYDAIGYQEDTSDPSFPKEFVANCVNLELKSMSLTLRDTNKRHSQVARLSVNDITANIDQRPAANALKVDASMRTFTVEGVPVDSNYTPMLVTPQTQDLLSTNIQTLLDLGFETNPLDGSCDQRVKLGARPLDIIYDAATINEVASFFKPPESVYLKQLQASAMAKFEELKEQTASGLQHAIDQHKYTDIHVDIQPTCLIIPDKGVYRQDAKMIVADLGQLKITSEKPDKSIDAQSPDLSFEEVMQRAYETFHIELNSIQVLYALPGEDWRHTGRKSITPMHVLNPMSLSINLSKSILHDPKMPKMRVIGELPSLNIAMSDVRLNNILDLARSIPLPESSPAPPEIDDANTIDVSSVAQSGDTGAILKNLAVSDDSSASSDDEFYDASSQVPRKRAPVAAQTSQDYTNFIDLQLEFVVKEVILSLKECKNSVDIPMMKVVLDNIGTKVTMTTFHMEAGVYLGGVYVQHQQFKAPVSTKLSGTSSKAVDNGPLVNLVNTPSDDNNNKLLTVNYMKANKKSPEFSSTYNNIEQKILIDFTVIEVLLHQEALLSLLKFAQSLQPPPDGATTTTTTVAESTATNKQATELSADALEMSEARRERKMMEEKDVVDIFLEAKLGTIALVVCTETKLMTEIKISGLKSTVSLQKAKIDISASLTDIVVYDPTEGALYSKILSIDGDSEGVFNAKISVYNFATKGAGYADMNNVDTDVQLNTGCMKVVFLNKFVMELLSFLDQFQAAKDAMAEASSAMAESAVNAAQDLAQKSPRIKLDIKLKAPVIVVPQSSTSHNALMIDLGDLSLSNSFIATQSPSNSDPGVVDKMTIQLLAVKVSRCITKNESTVAECLLLEPVNIVLVVKRNLSASWYHDVPDIDVQAKLESFAVALSQGDFSMVMSTLNENLTEGPKPVDKTSEAAPSAAEGQTNSEMITATDATTVNAEPTTKSNDQAVYTKIKFVCLLKMINATLYIGNSDLTEGISHRDKEKSLAYFGLQDISVVATILSDTSITANVQLNNCTLDDTRPGREKGITSGRVLEKRMIEQSTAMKNSQMIDVKFKQTQEQDKNLNVSVNGLYICVCLEYLMTVGDFFTKGLPQAPAQPPSSITKAITDTSVQPTEKPAAGGLLEIQLVIEQPEIIMVEDTMNPDTDALIMNTHVVFKLTMNADQQSMMGIIQNLQVMACCYAKEKRDSTKVLILNPTDISLQSSTPTGDGMHAELLVSDVIINVSPSTIRTITSTLSALTETPEEKTADPLDAIPKDLWQSKSVSDMDVWYLKTDEILEANEAIDHMDIEEVGTDAMGRGEQLLLTVSKIVLKFEGGVGSQTLPLLITEMEFKSEVRDWSTKLYISSELSMEVAYYNETLAVWEPLIEPTLCDDVMKPWEVTAEVIKSNDIDDAPDEDGGVALPTPSMVINVTSERALEVTMTKKCLEVINNLSKCFSDAYNLVESTDQADAVEAPYIIDNKTGLLVTANLDETFIPHKGSTSIALQSGDDVKLFEKDQKINKRYEKESIIKKTQTEICKKIVVSIDQYDAHRELNIVRAEKRSFAINQTSYPGDPWCMVCETSVSYGCKTVTLCSTLKVTNSLPYGIELYHKLSNDALSKCGEILPQATFCVPIHAVYTPPQELYFKVLDDRYGQSKQPFSWKDLKHGDIKTVTCDPAVQGQMPFLFNVNTHHEMILFENTSDKSSVIYTLEFKPHIVFRNLLPFDVNCLLEGTEEQCTVEGGKMKSFHEAKSNSILEVKIPSYLNTPWHGSVTLDRDGPTMTVCTMESYEGSNKITMDLGIHCLTEQGSTTFSLYCPYWMINKTGQTLTYKRKRNKKDEAGEDFSLTHTKTHEGSLLFSFKSQSFFSKNQTSLKVGESEWSDKFSLDTVGSAGTVTCKIKDSAHQVGVKNTLSSAGLTKIVVFTPYYMLVNHSSFAICIKENCEGSEWISIPADGCVPFWPTVAGKEKLMIAKVQDTDLETAIFKYAEPHTTLLKLDSQFGGINVEVQVMEDSIQILFNQYQDGSASVLLINHSARCPVEYTQNNVRGGGRSRLSPGDLILYTWQEPASKRELLWSCGDTQNKTDDLVKDGIGDCFFDSDTKIYWVSFLDGMQRVLLFTEDLALATVAQQAGELERADQEINLNLRGMGLSLVNNDINKEIAYMAITSSGVVWEAKKKRRYKAINNNQSKIIENAFQDYYTQLSIGNQPEPKPKNLPARVEVDFSGVTNSTPILMIKPNKTEIRRSFQNGIQVMYRVSPHQMQFHAKIHRLQLDNQLSGAIFNTVLAPVPLPKSVTSESVSKPFIETSMVIRKRDYSTVKQFKYAKILIQEMTLKVDQGFITAMMQLFATGELTEEQLYEQFKEDCKQQTTELKEDAAKSSEGEQKNFYDDLHFSPLKIHLSFSLYGTSGDDGNTQKVQQKSNVLTIFLQSVGVVMSDIQDVIFKLGYFERKYSFYNQSQLTSEIGGHYAQQAIKQMYVLVLGLDVLGNPFGLIRGVAEGIEDLFYEPYQGAIQGPEEFAEGLALGVRSLFGHAVGGAAGAVSRITGALGKGIATLTMDDEYQKQRREAMAKRPTDFKEGFARGGKGLVMGVVGGVTGIVTKPMEGAKQEGVEGFFKGMGKGLVGAFTRPASGMVDFASTSFEGIRRAAELGEEVRRLRPPRHLRKDGIVRPFVFKDAEGNDILNDLEKGVYAKTDMYVIHVIITNDMKNVLLVTNNRIVFVNKGELFGHWDCEWQYPWEELLEPPRYTSKGIQVLLKEKKKKSFFSSGTIGKMVPIADKQQGQYIADRIKELMTQNT